MHTSKGSLPFPSAGRKEYNMFWKIMGLLALLWLLFHLPLIAYSLAAYFIALTKVIRRRRRGLPYGSHDGPYHD